MYTSSQRQTRVQCTRRGGFYGVTHESPSLARSVRRMRRVIGKRRLRSRDGRRALSIEAGAIAWKPSLKERRTFLLWLRARKWKRLDLYDGRFDSWDNNTPLTSEKTEWIDRRFIEERISRDGKSHESASCRWQARVSRNQRLLYSPRAWKALSHGNWDGPITRWKHYCMWEREWEIIDWGQRKRIGSKQEDGKDFSEIEGSEFR